MYRLLDPQVASAQEVCVQLSNRSEPVMWRPAEGSSSMLISRGKNIHQVSNHLHYLLPSHTNSVSQVDTHLTALFDN